MFFKVTETERQGRISICKTCDKLTKLDFCSICKCYIPGKTMVSNEKCPIDKWGPIVKETTWKPQKKVD